MAIEWVKEQISEREDLVKLLEVDVLVEFHRLTSETKEEYDLFKEYLGNLELYDKMIKGYYIAYIFNPIDRMIQERRG